MLMRLWRGSRRDDVPGALRECRARKRPLTARPLVALAIGVAATIGISLASCSGSDLSPDVTLRPIDGGMNYFANISPRSAWMDQHILLGAWLEQPLNATEVGYDHATGDNIYWNLAGSPAPTAACGGSPCRADYNVIRQGGMHVSAPDTDATSGSETVAYEGSDESDMAYGPGWDQWNQKYNNTQSPWNSCVPPQDEHGACGYTVANWYYSGVPASFGSPGYPTAHTVRHQGYGKGVLFWETTAQAAKFMKFSDILSADSYWMTDPSLAVPSQGGCALFLKSPVICKDYGGSGLTNAQRALPANYAYNVTRLEQLQALNGPPKPVIVDVETGCPGSSHNCTTPAAMTAAAWHGLIAGARGILWFQHNFGGPCVDFRSIIDGSNPASGKYNCQQTPGVTLHDMVVALTRFNKEVTSLNTVLLAPFADHYVTSNGDVSSMAKYSNGVFYVFAGSGRPGLPPRPDQKVTLHLAGAPNTTVTVLNEHRTLRVVNGEFTDTFANADTVHIYRVG
jgi:hypothetical protein